jgi:hypothetical protein
VASIGTVSKTLAPTLRLGWVVCPSWLIEAVAQEKPIADRGSPGLDQLALATLIESGRYDRHLRHMRALYAERRAALAEALAAHVPGLTLTGLAAGFHAVAHLPDGLQERAGDRRRRAGAFDRSLQDEPVPCGWGDRSRTTRPWLRNLGSGGSSSWLGTSISGVFATWPGGRCRRTNESVGWLARQ